MSETAMKDDSTGSYSPNQLQKREVIIQAALDVIRQHGVAACTTRAVAEASPLTKSSIHYYFSDIDTLVDLAMERYSDELVMRVREAASREANPTAALDAAVRAYVVPGPSAVPAVWQEYYVMTLRRGDPSALRRTVAPVVDLISDLLSAIDERSSAQAANITSLLFGVLMLRPTHPIDPDTVVKNVHTIMGD
jgi:AcrR family transcriptional regulator